MDISFTISKKDKKFIEIVGDEYTNGYYTTEMSLNKGEFQYTDTATLNLLLKVDSEENEELIDSAVCEHIIEGTTVKSDYTVLEFNKDGLYRILHFIIPTKSWYETYIANYTTSLYTVNYVYDDGKIYKVNGTTYTEADIETFYQMNITDEYSLFYDDVYTFTMSDLKDCFFKIIEPLLKQLCGNSCSTNNTNIFNRDFIWMAINCIQYCLDIGNFFEAQRILESITGCSSICNSGNSSNSNSGCGCNKEE